MRGGTCEKLVPIEWQSQSAPWVSGEILRVRRTLCCRVFLRSKRLALRKVSIGVLTAPAHPVARAMACGGSPSGAEAVVGSTAGPLARRCPRSNTTQNSPSPSAPPKRRRSIGTITFVPPRQRRWQPLLRLAGATRLPALSGPSCRPQRPTRQGVSASTPRIAHRPMPRLCRRREPETPAGRTAPRTDRGSHAPARRRSTRVPGGPSRYQAARSPS